MLSSNARAAKRFKDRHGETFARVRDYYATIKDSVEIVDLRDVVPLFKSVTLTDEEQAISKGEPS